MKNFFFFGSFISLISIASFAQSLTGSFANLSEASDPQMRYCENLSDIDSMQDLTSLSLKDLQSLNQPVERIVVSKSRRRLYLISQGAVLRTFHVAFGLNPIGPKHFEGDNKTPEGLYSIDFKLANSTYTKALHITYPDAKDIAYAQARKLPPGGDIMIHGFPRSKEERAQMINVHPGDWTQGCVAVRNDEIEEIFALVDRPVLVEICSMSAR